MKHRITSAYHPQTNGLDERTNQTLKRAIGKTLDGHQERWEDKLKETVFAHNSCFNASSRYTPYRLMYGREPRLFSEVCKNLVVCLIVLSSEFKIHIFNRRGDSGDWCRQTTVQSGLKIKTTSP